MSDLRSKDGNGRESSELGRWLAIGMVMGAGFGMVLGAALDNMAFMSIGGGAGMCMGLAIGAAKQRARQDQDRGGTAG